MLPSVVEIVVYDDGTRDAHNKHDDDGDTTYVESEVLLSTIYLKFEEMLRFTKLHWKLC